MKKEATSTTTISVDQIQEALFFLEDLMDRLAVRFVLLGTIAKAARKGLLPYGDKIMIGVREQEFLETRIRTILSFIPDAVVTNKKISFTHKNGVKIEIKRIHKEYAFIRYPDSVTFLYALFSVPNPWDDYWKMRGVIQ